MVIKGSLEKNFFHLSVENFNHFSSSGTNIRNLLFNRILFLSNSKERKMLRAIIDSFPSPDRSVLLLLNFDIISRKCKAVKKESYNVPSSLRMMNNIGKIFIYNKQERKPYLPYF